MLRRRANPEGAIVVHTSNLETGLTTPIQVETQNRVPVVGREAKLPPSCAYGISIPTECSPSLVHVGLHEYCGIASNAVLDTGIAWPECSVRIGFGGWPVLYISGAYVYPR